MFRRRTDQVYSTLQQVQRRITEQNGNPVEHADPLLPASLQPQPAVNLQPLSQALPSGGNVAVALTPQPQAFAGMPAARLGPAGKRYVLQVSGDLAMLLVVMWLISMALMFVLGQHWRSSGGAGLAAGAAGNRELPGNIPAAKRQGDWVYVLQSQPNATVESSQFFEERARSLNDFVRQNANRGWKGYFGVRKPSNGGVELAYGLVDGVWGIDQAEFVAFAKLLADPTSKGGGGYASARWVKVDQ
jgi:hypothetical protein